MTLQAAQIGLLSVEIHIPASGSLKSKRKVLKSLKDRIHSRFNVSIAETDYQDKWQRAVLSVCNVGTDKSYLNGCLDKVLLLIESYSELEVIRRDLEFL